MSTTTPTKRKQCMYRPERERARNLQLQERDLLVIRQVMEDRFLSAQQLAKLFFPSYEMAKKRLQKLWNAGYLKREFLPVTFGSSPAIYCLTHKGKELLLQQGVVPAEEVAWHKDRNRGSHLFKRHELDLNDLKVALTVACQGREAVQLYHFGKGQAYHDRVTNPQIEGGEKDYIPICPDGFAILQQGGSFQYLFVEVDRGTIN